MVVRSAGTHVLPAQNKSDKITFSKLNFLPQKNLKKNRCFADFTGYLCKACIKSKKKSSAGIAKSSNMRYINET